MANSTMDRYQGFPLQHHWSGLSNVLCVAMVLSHTSSQCSVVCATMMQVMVRLLNVLWMAAMVGTPSLASSPVVTALLSVLWVAMAQSLTSGQVPMNVLCNVTFVQPFSIQWHFQQDRWSIPAQSNTTVGQDVGILIAGQMMMDGEEW